MAKRRAKVIINKMYFSQIEKYNITIRDGRVEEITGFINGEPAFIARYQGCAWGLQCDKVRGLFDYDKLGETFVPRNSTIKIFPLMSEKIIKTDCKKFSDIV